jgi:hypothetical protein
MRTNVLPDHLVSKGALRSSVGLLISYGMFSFHCAGGECHEIRDLRYGNDDSSLRGEEELAWFS